MDASVTEPQARRSAAPVQGKAKAHTPLETIAEMIVEALVYFRGSAHRQTVIDFVAAKLARMGEKFDAKLTERIIQAFDRHRADLAGSMDELFYLPFGAGSHRWSLTKQQQALRLSNVY